MLNVNLIMQAVEINNETLVPVTVEPAGPNKVEYNGLIYDIHVVESNETVVLKSEYHQLPDNRYTLLYLRVSKDFSKVLPGSHLELGTYRTDSENKNDLVSYSQEMKYQIMDSTNFRNFKVLIDHRSILHRFLQRLPDYYYEWVNNDSVKLAFPSLETVNDETVNDELGHGDSPFLLGNGYSFLLNVSPMVNVFIKSLFDSERYENEYLSELPVGEYSFVLIEQTNQTNGSPRVEYSNGSVVIVLPVGFCEGCQYLLDSLEVIKSYVKNINIYVPPVETIITELIPPSEGGGCCGGGSCGSCGPGGCGSGTGETGKDSEQLTGKTDGKGSCACGGGNCNTPEPCESSECCKKKPEPFESIPVYQENVYVLFMKGTPGEPKCKYSRQMVELLNQNGISYDSVNLNDHPELKPLLKEHFPTFPQLWYNNKFLINLSRLVEQGGKL